MTTPVHRSPRRRWLIGVVAGWILVVAGLGWWSVRNDPPTVPEQRSIADALPVLNRATGALVAAASGPDRAVELGGLSARDCRLTPVRRGVDVVRDITVYVPVDQALTVFREIAEGLPDDYAADSGSNTGGRRVGLHADAGGFVAIDASADSDSQVFQVTASTGCRPKADVDLDEESAAAAEPDSLRQVRAALGAEGGAATVREIACPDGSVARTYTVDGVPAPADLGRSLESVVAGATVVRAEPAGWAYVTGTDSVIVAESGDALRVSATVPCS